MFLQTCEKEKRKCSNKTVENRKIRTKPIGSSKTVVKLDGKLLHIQWNRSRGGRIRMKHFIEPLNRLDLAHRRKFISLIYEFMKWDTRTSRVQNCTGCIHFIWNQPKHELKFYTNIKIYSCTKHWNHCKCNVMVSAEYWYIGQYSCILPIPRLPCTFRPCTQ